MEDLTGTPDAFPVKWGDDDPVLQAFKAWAVDGALNEATPLGIYAAGWNRQGQREVPPCHDHIAEIERLQTYIIYTPCPSCGLADPDRPAANCDQCAKARAALGRGSR